MTRPVRTRANPDEVRARILEVAEEHYRRIGHHKTSVTDIASELGMSRANVYRFFPSRDAINEFICRRVVSEVTNIAIAIARTDAPALEKLDRLLTAVHHHNKTKLIKDHPLGMHLDDRPVLLHGDDNHVVNAPFEAIIREGVEAGELKVEDPAELARAVNTTPFFQSRFNTLHPILIEHCVQHGEDTEAGLREQIRFILKALGKSHQGVPHTGTQG